MEALYTFILLQEPRLAPQFAELLGPAGNPADPMTCKSPPSLKENDKYLISVKVL